MSEDIKSDAPKIVDLTTEPGEISERDGRRYRLFDTVEGPQEFEIGDDGRPLKQKIEVVLPSGQRKSVRPRLGGPRVGSQGGCLDALRDRHPDTWDLVEGMLARGESSYTIATRVKEMGVLPDVSWDTLKAALHRHRNRALKARLKETLGGNVAKSPDRLLTRINVIEQVERMVGVQQSRYEKVLTRETTLANGMLLDQVSKEGDRLMDYLQRLGTLYFDTGIMARAPKVMKGVIASSGADPINGARTVAFQLSEEELPLIEGLRDELTGQYVVPAG